MATGEVRQVGSSASAGPSPFSAREHFCEPFDVETVKKTIGDVVAWKVLDAHMSPAEKARMWQMAEDAGGG